jgi:hypothetical protein
VKRRHPYSSHIDQEIRRYTNRVIPATVSKVMFHSPQDEKARMHIRSSSRSPNTRDRNEKHKVPRLSSSAQIHNGVASAVKCAEPRSVEGKQISYRFGIGQAIIRKVGSRNGCGARGREKTGFDRRRRANRPMRCSSAVWGLLRCMTHKVLQMPGPGFATLVTRVLILRQQPN